MYARIFVFPNFFLSLMHWIDCYNFGFFTRCCGPTDRSSGIDQRNSGNGFCTASEPSNKAWLALTQAVVPFCMRTHGKVGYWAGSDFKWNHCKSPLTLHCRKTNWTSRPLLHDVLMQVLSHVRRNEALFFHWETPSGILLNALLLQRHHRQVWSAYSLAITKQ